MNPPVKTCKVCNRDPAKLVAVTGGSVLLCKDCAKDRFMIAEAEKRLALQVTL